MCLVVYRDERVKATLLYRLTDNEWEEEITEDIENLKSVGVEIESITSDGGRSIIKGGSRNLVGIGIQLSDSEEEELFVHDSMQVCPEEFDFWN